MEFAHDSHDHTDSKLSDGFGGVCRYTDYFESKLLGLLQVNIIESCTSECYMFDSVISKLLEGLENSFVLVQRFQ